MKPMTNEEMAVFLDHRSDTSNDVHAAIARRIRLLGAVHVAASGYVYESSRFEPDNLFQAKLKQSVDALDADERGEVKDGN